MCKVAAPRVKPCALSDIVTEAPTAISAVLFILLITGLFAVASPVNLPTPEFNTI